MTNCPADVLSSLHETGQGALFDLGLATMDMTADEKWAVEQLLLAYVADSVPPDVWAHGLDSGVRAVLRGRARDAAGLTDAF